MLASLAKQFEAGATNALHHDGGHLHRYTGIQADMTRQTELVEVTWRHIAGHHRADVIASDAGDALGRRQPGGSGFAHAKSSVASTRTWRIALEQASSTFGQRSM